MRFINTLHSNNIIIFQAILFMVSKKLLQNSYHLLQLLHALLQ